MEIRVNSGEELNRLLDALARDVVDAHVHYRLLNDLIKVAREYQREIAQSNTFWQLTMLAHKDAYLSRLCRIFDQNSIALNLYNFLDTLKANIHYFGESHFRDRLRENAFVDSLAKYARIPLIEELEGDIEFASIRNPVVEKLMRWRNNYHAHLGAKVPLKKVASLDSLRIEQPEIENLLERCLLILNRYSGLYKATTWSPQIVGHDDYLYLLKFVRDGLNAREIAIKRQIAGRPQSS